MDKRSRLARTVSLRAKAAGIAKRLGSLAKLTVGSVDYTPQQLVAILEDELDSIATVQQAEVHALRRPPPRAHDLEEEPPLPLERSRAVVRHVRRTPDELGDFGLKPQRTGKKSAQSKADAAEKARATRASGGKGRRKPG